MDTPPTSATLPDTPQKRHLPLGAGIAALLVPVVTALGVISSLYVQVIHEDWVDRQQAACRIMARPQMEFVVAWGGPALGVAAVILCVLLARRTRRRHGVRLGETWPGLIAYLSVGANALAILLELFMLYAAFSSDGSGSVLGDCG